MRNEKGQAIIETCIIMMAVNILVAGLLWAVYLSITVQWCDYWVYRGNMCLVEGNSKYQCQLELKEKIRYLVPETYFRIDDIWISSRNSKVRVQLSLPRFQRFFTSEITLPLARRI
jgi:hypothetical protein